MHFWFLRFSTLSRRSLCISEILDIFPQYYMYFWDSEYYKISNIFPQDSMYFWDFEQFPIGFYVFLRFWTFSQRIIYMSEILNIRFWTFSHMILCISEILNIFPHDSMYFWDFKHFTTWFYVFHRFWTFSPQDSMYFRGSENFPT
jgi:hypothetical protein